MPIPLFSMLLTILLATFWEIQFQIYFNNNAFSLSLSLSLALRNNAGHGLLILEVFLDHIQRRTTVGMTPLDE
jgi:hypothetical protein